MPQFTIQDPTGRTLVVEGDAEPSPKQIQSIFKANPPKQTSSALGALASESVRQVAPTAAFMTAFPTGAKVGALAGAAIPGLGETGIPEAVGGVLGGLVSGGAAAWAAATAQSKIADVAAPKSLFASKIAAQQEKDHPLATMVGAGVALGKPNPARFVSALETLATQEGRGALLTAAKKGIESLTPEEAKRVSNVHHVVMNGGANVLFNTYDQIKSGNVSPTQIIQAAATGALFNEPWAIKPHPAARGMPEPTKPEQPKFTPKPAPLITPQQAEAGLREPSVGEGIDVVKLGKPAPKPAEAPISPPARPTTSEAVSPAKAAPAPTVSVPEGVKEQPVEVKPAEVAPKAPKPTSLRPDQLKPALRVGESIVTGGDTHQHIADNAKTPEAQQALKDDKNHIFVDEQGNRYNRKQAAKLIGQKEPLHSEDLIAIREGKAQSATPEKQFVPVTVKAVGKYIKYPATVSGRQFTVDSFPEARFVAQKFSNKAGYRVFEKSTGLGMATYGKTLNEALENTRKKIDEVGVDKMRELIKKADKINIETPSAKKPITPPPTDTPTQATEKVAEHLQDVKQTEGSRPAKEIKSELVQRLEKAIEDAPELTDQQQEALAKTPAYAKETDFEKPEKLSRKPDTRAQLAREENARRLAVYNEEVKKSGLKQITIDIPGDGSFTIWNHKGAIESVLERAKKISTATEAKQPTAFTKVRPTGNIPADVWVESSEPTHKVTVSAGNVKSQKLGKRIEIKGLEGKELYLTSDGKEFTITEPQTGFNIGRGDKISDAVKDADGIHEELKQKKMTYDEVVKRNVSANGKLPKPEPIAPQAPTTGTETKPRFGKGGPGAGAFGEPGTYSPIQEMADRLRTTSEPSKPLEQQISAIDKVKLAATDAKAGLNNQLAKLVAVKDAIYQKWKSLPEYRDEQRAVGKWFYALQKADAEARNFAKAIVKEVPDKIRREAITNWIQAEGDKALLNERAELSKGSLKKGYEIAQNLTPREIEIAEMLRNYYDKQLQEGIDSGILKEGLENYITQVWKKENPITKKLVADLAAGKLPKNFKFARKRVFDSYFEGEQAGYTPMKDAGFLVANYDQSFNKTLAARAFIKDLHEGKASDGRPLVEISGQGKIIGEDEGKPSVLIKPSAKPEELNDYRVIDHPALRGWKWASKTPEGKDVFIQGDMLVHPEAYQKLRNRLSTSYFQQSPVLRAGLALQTGIKQTMLSVSGFHQVQETLHALGHRVNPTNMPEIDFSEPVTKGLVEHGLQLADYNALQSFSEGLSGGGLTTKIPVVGAKLHAYNEWLFQDYIPRLKLQVAKISLERNRERYKDLSEDKQLELAASIGNSAFGELPYKYWGRNPTFQDALRAFILAPDFLESRVRFVGQAVKPFGHEQLMALGVLAATQYITARILNQTLSGDPHLEPKNAFKVIVGNHAYSMRTIPSDLEHLFTDTRGFFYNRMSPALRTAVTAVSGRDSRSVKRDIVDQAKDLVKMPVPISLSPKAGQKWWESFVGSLGVQNQRWDAIQTINERVKAFKKDNNIVTPTEIIYNQQEDKFAALRLAIENDDKALAEKEYQKLKASVPTQKIQEHFKLSYSHPLTGSKENDAKFVKGLDATVKEEYKEAMQLRQARLQMIKSLR